MCVVQQNSHLYIYIYPCESRGLAKGMQVQILSCCPSIDLPSRRLLTVMAGLNGCSGFVIQDRLYNVYIYIHIYMYLHAQMRSSRFGRGCSCGLGGFYICLHIQFWWFSVVNKIYIFQAGDFI